MTDQDIYSELIQLIGADSVIRPEDRPGDDRITRPAVVDGSPSRPDYILPAIDGKIPRFIVIPGNVDEISAILEWADQRGLAICPVGGGSRLTFGQPPAKYDIALSLSKLNRVIAYEPADMTVTVEAGMTVADLQRYLQKSGQMLPIDAPGTGCSTVGGMIAIGATGPIGLTYAKVSDHILGTQVVLANGTIAHSGGRVVKNVSGYEMSRIYTGSLGTLAVITQVTFKVQPVLEKGAALFLQPSDYTHADTIASALRTCDAEPVFLEMTGPKPLKLIAGYAGTEQQVAWMLKEAEQAVLSKFSPGHSNSRDTDSTGIFKRLPWSLAYTEIIRSHRFNADPTTFTGIVGDFDPIDTSTTESTVRDVMRAGNDRNVLATCTVFLPDVSMASFLTEAESIVDQEVASVGINYSFAAHAGSAIVRLHLWPTHDLPEEVTNDDNVIAAMMKVMAAWRQLAERQNGRLIIEAAPTKVKHTLDTWGKPGEDFFLHRAIKNKMDPNSILNPGRFIGGI